MRKTGGRLATRTALLVSVATIGLLFQGCGGSDEEADGESSSGEEVELVFYNQSRGQEEALNQLAAQYTEETGIVVTVDTPGPADYGTKLQAKAQSEDMPDLYSIIDPDQMAPYYKAGWAMDLSSEMEGEWGDSFNPAAIELSTWAEGNNLGVDAGIYGAHWDFGTYGLLVNTEATGIEAGDPPATMDDLISALQEQDATFSVAASLTPSLLQYYASNFMTDEEIDATLGGEQSWETDGWRQAFQLLVDLRDAGVIANGSLPGGTDDNPVVERSFFNIQDVAVIMDGSAGIAVASATAPDFTEFISIGLPAATDGTMEPRSPARVGRGAAVNPKGEHPDEALEFLKWLTEPEQQAVFAAAGMIPTNAELLAAGEVPESVAGYADLADGSQVVLSAFSTDVRDAISAGAQSIVLGEKTIDEVLSEVQDAQDLTS